MVSFQLYISRSTNADPPHRDQELRFTVHESPDYYNLKVSVFNDDKRTDLIGETWVSLEEVVVPGGGKGDKWHGLNCKGKYAGDIRIELTYYDTRVSSERQALDGMQISSRAGLGGSPVMAGPRQQPAVRRRPLPADPSQSSPATTPDRGAATTQSSFGPRSYHTPPHQRPLPASNSPSGFAIRDTPVSSPASFQPEHYQLSEPPTEHSIQYDDRYNHEYEVSPHEERYDQPDVSSYSLQYPDDVQSVHPSEQEWSESPTQGRQQHYIQHGRHDQRGPPLPHSYSAPSTFTALSEDYSAAGQPLPEPNIESDHGYDHHDSWSRDQRMSLQMHSMQPTVEDEQPAPPPPPAHRNSAPTLANYRSTPNLNSSMDMRAYAAHRHRMSIAENSPQSSALAHSPYGDQGLPQRGSPYTHPSQGSAYSTPTRLSHDTASHTSPQSSPIVYQRQQYTPVETAPPAPFPYERHSTPNSVPLIKPRPISPTTRPSPVSAPPQQSSLPTSSHSTPIRKSVSPHPTPPGSAQGMSSTPFSPDSYDAFNPVLKGRSPVQPDPQTQAHSSPSPNITATRKSITPRDSHSNEPIITSTGHLVDPSDHLPADSWAPEPERKGSKANSEIGAEERANRPSPRGAQPMITVRTKAGNSANSVPVIVTRKPYTQPSGMLSSPAPPVSVNPSPPPHPNPTSHSPISAATPPRDTGAIVAVSGGRNRLVKKSRPGAPSSPLTSIPPPNHDALSHQPSYEDADPGPPYYASDPGHGYGYGSEYGGYRGALPPPVPAKIPLQTYGGGGAEPAEMYPESGTLDLGMLALSEEMKRIDIGPAPGMGGRARRNRYGQ